MERSILTAASRPTRSGPPEFSEAFRFLAFNQATGEILSYGARAIFALARADLCEPDEAIEVLNAGIAGKDLWEHQTSLPMARLVIDMLDDTTNVNQPAGAAKLGLA